MITSTTDNTQPVSETPVRPPAIDGSPSGRSVSEAGAPQKVVVVHRGARDNYQVSRALAEVGMLESLVTDLYWPADKRWAQRVLSMLPASMGRQLLARYVPGLPSSKVRGCLPSGPASFLLDKVNAPFPLRQRAQRWADASLGTAAGRFATQRQSLLLSYSYYGFHAFSAHRGPNVLFQLHPHPASVRRILSEELAAHPECRASLSKEWELSLPPEDFGRLVAETGMASHWLAASSFTRSTLVENGIPHESIDVIPYGVDTTRFCPKTEPARRLSGQPLKLLFVGSINQRKGIKYLLDAMRLLGGSNVELTVCGRVVDGLELFSSTGSRVHVRPSVTFPELLEAYRTADLFVLPSVVEGFAQVLLEALACGLPILSTTHTAAPDLITSGVEGWVVEPRRPDLLAERIESAIRNRGMLGDMRQAARKKAEEFTWEAFRMKVVQSIQNASGFVHNGRETGPSYV